MKIDNESITGVTGPIGLPGDINSPYRAPKDGLYTKVAYAIKGHGGIIKSDRGPELTDPMYISHGIDVHDYQGFEDKLHEIFRSPISIGRLSVVPDMGVLDCCAMNNLIMKGKYKKIINIARRVAGNPMRALGNMIAMPGNINYITDDYYRPQWNMKLAKLSLGALCNTHIATPVITLSPHDNTHLRPHVISPDTPVHVVSLEELLHGAFITAISDDLLTSAGVESLRRYIAYQDGEKFTLKVSQKKWDESCLEINAIFEHKKSGLCLEYTLVLGSDYTRMLNRTQTYTPILNVGHLCSPTAYMFDKYSSVRGQFMNRSMSMHDSIIYHRLRDSFGDLVSHFKKLDSYKFDAIVVLPNQVG